IVDRSGPREAFNAGERPSILDCISQFSLLTRGARRLLRPAVHWVGRGLKMSIRSVVPAAMACAVGVSLGSIAPAAAEPSRLAIELNALKSAASDCQMALLFTNGLAIDIDALALELVVFDGEGVMDRVLRVKSSDLPAGRKRLKLFKLEGLDCAAV